MNNDEVRYGLCKQIEAENVRFKRRVQKRIESRSYVYDCCDRTRPSSPFKARLAIGSVRRTEKVIVKFSRGPKGWIPQKAHETDAGFDLRAPERVVVPAHGSAVIDTDVCVLIPDGFCGMLKSKSGLNVKHNIRGEGVIDAGYTGHIVAKLYNDGDWDYTFNKGDKIIQLVIIELADIELVEGETDINTERGANGFGSTGR